MSHGQILRAAFLLLGAACAQAEEPSLGTLDYLRIKYQRDPENRIVAIEFPPGARDYHLEAVLDNPAILPHIEEIKAPRCRASFARVKELATLPSLTSVSLDESKDANDYVVCLRDVKTLKKLSLVGSGLTNHGLYDIGIGLGKLVELDVTGTKIDNLGLAPLAKLEHLETLRLGRLRQARSPPGSTEEEQAEDKRRFRYIASLPRLKRVNVQGVDVATEDLLVLACNCHLEELNFEETLDLKTEVETLIYLQECQPSLLLGPAIAKKIIGRYQVGGDDWIRDLDQCTQSQLLRIPKPQLAHLGGLRIRKATSLEFLKWLPRLKSLELWDPAMNSKELAGIKNAATLQSVSIIGAKIDAEIVKALTPVPSLSFSRCEIDDAARALLAADPRRGRTRINP